MTLCWKCGAQTTNNDSECDNCAPGGPLNLGIHPLPPRPVTYEVDWSRINTIEELRAFISAVFPSVMVPPGLELPESFKRFLKRPDQN